MLLDTMETTIENSQSLLAFERPKADGVFGFWDEYLTIAGKKSYQIGVACAECSFSFERIDEDSISKNTVINMLSQEIKEQLDTGIEKIDQHILDDIKAIVPNGKYQVVLTSVLPKLVVPQQQSDYFVEELAELDYNAAQNPYNTKTNYFRLNTAALPNEDFFEFLIPIKSLDSLDKQRVKQHEELLVKGNRPTAVALSKITYGEPPHRLVNENALIINHIVLSHYLIDGLHKVYASAKTQKPIALLFFVPQDHGAEYIEHLKSFL